jgi:hypothetical protein
LLVVGALMVACSDDSGGTSFLADELPLLPGPGEPLLDGYVVPEGAQLLGEVFPFDQLVFDGHHAESSWTASFVVAGDPRIPLDDVLDQARSDGMETRSNCIVRPEQVDCQARARKVIDGFLEGEVVFRVTRGPTSQSGGISYQRFAPGVRPVDGSFIPGVWDDPQDEHWTPSPPASFPPAEVPGRRPGVGEPFAEDQQGVDPLIVVPEGTVVALPVAEDTCATGGFDAVLFIPGDLAPVVADVEEQFSDGFSDAEVTRARVQGIRTVQVSSYQSGAGGLSFDAVVSRDGSGGWARIGRCND